MVGKASGGRVGPERGDKPLENDRALQRARGLRAFRYLSNNIYYLSSEDTLAVMEESVAILRRLGPPARRELGISLLFKGEPVLLTTEWQEMHEILQQGNEKFYLSEYLFRMNEYAYYRGEMDKAEAYVKESLAISRDIEDYDGISSRISSLGFFARLAGDYPRAEALLREGMDASQKVRNRWWEMYVQVNLVEVALAQGLYEEATRLSEAALTKYQEMNYRSGIAYILKTLLVIAWAQGDYQKAVRLGRELIDVYQENSWYRIWAYYYLGRVALSQNDFIQAEGLIKQATSLLNLDWGALAKSSMLMGWAALYNKQGKLPQAAYLLGAANEVYQRIALGLPLRERSENAETEATTRTALGEEAFTAAWEEGKAMTLEQAVGYVQS